MTALLEGLAVLFVVAVAVVAHAVIQRSRAYDSFSAHNEVAGFLLTMVGVVYAVVLGFVVIVVWQRYTAAEGYVDDEASAVANAYRLSSGLPAATRVPIRADVRAYIDDVVQREWPLMQRGVMPGTSTVLEDAAHRVDTLQPASRGAGNVQEAMMDAFERVFDARRLRLSAIAPSVKPVLWLALVLGGTVMLGFAYLFGTRNRGAQLAMTGAITAIMALLILVVVEFDTPYNGSVEIQPAVWTDLAQRLPAIR